MFLGIILSWPYLQKSTYDYSIRPLDRSLLDACKVHLRLVKGSIGSAKKRPWSTDFLKDNIILYAWMLVRSICVWLRALLEMQKKRPRSTNFLKDEYNLEFPSVIQGLHFFIKKWNPLNKESCPGRWFAQRPSWMKTHLLRSNECQTDVRGLFRSPQKQVIGSIND